MNADIHSGNHLQPVASGDDREFARRLALAWRMGRVAIVPDMHRLQHIHSPVLSQADGNQWLVGIAVVLGVVWWKLGWVWAGVGLVPAGVLYAILGRRSIRQRMLTRIGSQMENPPAWNKLWEFGGLALEEKATGRRCAAPDGDWRSFASALQVREIPGEDAHQVKRATSEASHG